MEGFLKWFNDGAKLEDTYGSAVKKGVFVEVSTVKDAWQEATKQATDRIVAVAKKEIGKYDAELEPEEIYALGRFLVVLDRIEGK